MSYFTESRLYKKVVPKRTQEIISSARKAAQKRRDASASGNVQIPMPPSGPDLLFGGNVGDLGGMNNQFNRPSPPPTLITPIQAKSDMLRDAIGPQISELRSIDPSAQYRLGSGEVVSGRHVQGLIVKDIALTGRSVARTPSFGAYLNIDGMYTNLSSSGAYLYAHGTSSDKKDILRSLREDRPANFIGPVYDPFPKAYEHLSSDKKETYGFLFTPWSSIDPSQIKYYPGGMKYLTSLKSDERDRLISKVLKYNKSFPQEGIGDISAVELSRRSGLYVSEHYHDYGIDELFKNARNTVAWDALTEDPALFKEKTFMKYSWHERFQIAGISAAGDVAFGTASLPQLGYKLVTGRSVGPDIMKGWETARPGGPYDILTTGISEGAAHLTGSDSRAWERFAADPLSGLAATGSSFLTMWGAGQGFHAAKVGTIRGLGRVRGFGLEHGVNLPSYAQISFHYPQRILRRAWVQYGTRNIDDVIGKPYHSIETLTHRGLSFAPGGTPMNRVHWTIQRSLESRSLPLSADDFLVGSASGQRIGSRFVIKAQALHELPALSAAPYGYTPTRFYRFGASNLSYGSSFSLIPKMHFPSGFAIRLKNVFVPPRGSYDDIARWAFEQPKGSWGTIGPKMYLGGPETELNIFGRSVLKRFLPDDSGSLLQRLRGYQYYTDVPLQEMGFLSGKPLVEKVPVVFTSPVHKGFPSGVTSIVGRSKSKLDDLFSSSMAVEPSTSLFNPVSISALYTRALSSKGSTVSSPSRASSSYSPSVSRGSSSSRPSSSSSSYSKSLSSGSGSRSLGSNISKSISRMSSSQNSISRSIISSSSFGYSRSRPSPSFSFISNYDSLLAYGKSEMVRPRHGIVLDPKVVDPRYLFREFKIPSLDDIFKKIKF